MLSSNMAKRQRPSSRGDGRCGSCQSGCGLSRMEILDSTAKEEISMAGVRHLDILPENVENGLNFHPTAFGLKVVHGIGTAPYLSDGHINLAIIPIGPERKIEGDQLKAGIYHFGFEVEDVDALRGVCDELNAATGIDKRPPNREAEFRVHDPDGNPIDLSKHGWPI